MNSDEDEDLARAIALSLNTTSAKKPEIVDLISDDDDSHTPGTKARGGTARKTSSKAKAPPNVTNQLTHRTVDPVISSFLSERAQLEKERRERQKRLRGKGDSSEEESPAKRQRSGSSSVSTRTDNSPSSTSSSNSTRTTPTTAHAPDSSQEQFFFDGELRQTATQHAEPRKDGQPTFRLTEILGKDLSFAILSSYSLDMPWIYQFFDPSVPVIMVAQPDGSGEAILKYAFPNWIKTTAALPAGRGCMHMKFMLLFYKTGRLRVVVSTANLIAYDWRDMENSVWLQDVPLRSSPIPHDPRAPEDFPTVLQRVLHAVKVRPALVTMQKDSNLNLPIKSIEDLRMRWDWSKVKVHLIPSIAGKHEGWPNVIKTGHTRLMIAIRNMGLRTSRGRTVTLECQGSSLGYYSTQWMNEFHWSARGESAEDWLDEPKRRREKLPYPRIKILFPTKKIVQESALGELGGGTIFCKRRQWAAKNFPRDKFYESRSKAGPVLMHSKMIIALLQDGPFKAASESSDAEDDEIQVVETFIGWAYVGSHNFTPSAWGNLSGSAFDPILNISNYELGIAFPLRDKQHANKLACWTRPPKQYTSRDEPWIQEESVYFQEGQ
ncbi:Tyrosyl-DNA phosphodiesterase domain containing protein [Amanita muscaria]